MASTSDSKEMIDEMLLLPYDLSLASEYNFDLGLLDQYGAQHQVVGARLPVKIGSWRVIISKLIVCQV